MKVRALLLFGAAWLASSSALAHVSIDGPAFARSRQVLTFGVGHGCAGADTIGVEVHIPEEVTALRALPGPFGEPVLTRDETERVVRVVWSKDQARADDDLFYAFQMRITVPATPFTTLYFPTTQLCRDADGNETQIEWAELPGEETDKDEPAPALLVLPARAPGWNKVTAPAAIADLSVFDDAQIVWVGQAAYSGNATTKELIEAEPDVELLEEIAAGADIWVKY